LSVPVMASKAKAATQAKKKIAPYHHGDLRRTLLDGALAIVEKSGLGALSLRELARRVGVSHAAPYRHFPSREALLVELAIEGFVGLEAEMLKDAALAAGAADRFAAIGLAYVRYAVAHPGHFRVMFSSELHDDAAPALTAAGKPALSALVEAVAAGQADGLIGAGDPRALAVPAWSMVHGLAMLIIDRQLTPLVDGAVVAETWARAVVEVIARGWPPVTKPARKSPRR
jgi:AcrR family transcriptional regulator